MVYNWLVTASEDVMVSAYDSNQVDVIDYDSNHVIGYGSN